MATTDLVCIPYSVHRYNSGGVLDAKLVLQIAANVIENNCNRCEEFRKQYVPQLLHLRITALTAPGTMNIHVLIKQMLHG